MVPTCSTKDQHHNVLSVTYTNTKNLCGSTLSNHDYQLVNLLNVSSVNWDNRFNIYGSTINILGTSSNNNLNLSTTNNNYGLILAIFGCTISNLAICSNSFNATLPIFGSTLGNLSVNSLNYWSSLTNHLNSINSLSVSSNNYLPNTSIILPSTFLSNSLTSLGTITDLSATRRASGKLTLENII